MSMQVIYKTRIVTWDWALIKLKKDFTIIVAHEIVLNTFPKLAFCIMLRRQQYIIFGKCEEAHLILKN